MTSAVSARPLRAEGWVRGSSGRSRPSARLLDFVPVLRADVPWKVRHARSPAWSCPPITPVIPTTRSNGGTTRATSRRRRPALRVSAHVLSRRRRSAAGESVALGGARSPHGALRGQRSRRRGGSTRSIGCSARAPAGPARRSIAMRCGTAPGAPRRRPMVHIACRRRTAAWRSIWCSAARTEW